MPSKKGSSSVKAVPSEEDLLREVLERQAQNLESLREAHRVAKDAFRTTEPTYEMVDGVRGAIASGVSTDVLSGLVGEATAIGKRIGATDVASTLALLDILIEDDEAEAHLKDAEAEAKRLFPSAATGETTLDIYFDIYGADEEESDDLFESDGQ